MKKLMTVCAACMVAGLVSAQVESQNIVGYGTTSINPAGALTINNAKQNLIGLNWESVGGGTIAINDLFGGDAEGAGLIANASFAAADQIQVWTGAGYKTYYLYTGYGSPAYDNKWYEIGNDTYPTTDTLSAGQGFWLLSRDLATTDIDLNFSGEVKDDATAALSIIGTGLKQTMLSNPYATDLVLNDGSFDWTTQGSIANASFASADQIQVWTGSGFKTYYLYTGYGSPTYDNKWYEVGNDTYPTTDSIAMGAGFWYVSRASADFTINLPKTY